MRKFSIIVSSFKSFTVYHLQTSFGINDCVSARHIFYCTRNEAAVTMFVCCHKTYRKIIFGVNLIFAHHNSFSCLKMISIHWTHTLCPWPLRCVAFNSFSSIRSSFRFFFILMPLLRCVILCSIVKRLAPFFPNNKQNEIKKETASASFQHINQSKPIQQTRLRFSYAALLSCLNQALSKINSYFIFWFVFFFFFVSLGEDSFF